MAIENPDPIPPDLTPYEDILSLIKYLDEQPPPTPEEQLARECENLFWPDESLYRSLPDDPRETITLSHRAVTDYAKEILGGNHPLIRRIKENIAKHAQLLKNYHCFIKDTLDRHPVYQPDGKPVDADSALSSCIKYFAAVTNRYLVVDTVLRALESESKDATYVPLEYKIGNRTKIIILHHTCEQVHDKQKIYGDQPAFAIRPPGFPFDLVIINNDVNAFLEKLEQQRVLEVLKGFLDGQLYIPDRVRRGLPNLDYILLFELGTAMHHNIKFGDHKGKGICLPISSFKWLDNGLLSPLAAKEILAVAHETEHSVHSSQFDLPGIYEFIISEYNSFMAELDTVEHHPSLDDQFFVASTRERHVPAAQSIILGQGWQKYGFNHNDIGRLNRLGNKIRDLSPTPEVITFLQKTIAYLKNYPYHPS